MRFMFNAVLLCLFLVTSTRADTNSTIRFMTFNLRYASDKKPNSWPERRPVMKDCILSINPDLFGTQEGLYHQLKDIENDLGAYRWIGTGRDGGSRGEFMAIFYKPERFEPMEYNHFWLSDTPDVIGSTTWGNSNRRMVTWVRFKDKADGREFYFANTHFDHEIQLAREKSAQLLRERVSKLNQELPIIVAGDFNAKAGANKAYDILTEGDFLTDLWKTAKEHRGDIVNTFHNFHGPRKGDNRNDWILGHKVKANWIEINTCSKEGQFPSDHFPVVAELRFE
jgi:endonuclease/exonuclease/phosphatase family metal-dependent hydrolase